MLKAECFGCHNAEKKKGGLVLTSRESLLKGGDEGPVVAPGKPDESKLARALLPEADPHMPPKKQLDDAQIKAIREWIKRGLVWDAAALAEEKPIAPDQLSALPASYQPVVALALSPDGKRLAVGRGGQVIVHDASQTNFPIVAQVEAHRDVVQALAWSGDGRWLVSGAFRRVVFWEGESLEQAREITDGLVGRVSALEFAPDEKTLALADGETTQSGFVQLIDVASGKQTASWRAHGDTIYDLEFSRDGQRLVTASGDKLIKVWEVASRKELATLEGHTAQVLAAAFNTNATQVASGGADKQLKVWDVATKEKIISLGNHSHAITALTWPGDNQALFAVTDGGSAFRYTDLKAHTGEQSSASGNERKLSDSDESLLSLATSADGKTIFAGSHAGAVHVWNNEGKLLARLAPCANAPGVAAVALAPKPAGRGVLTALSRRAGDSPHYQHSSGMTRAGGALPIAFKPSSVVSLSAEPKEIHLYPDSPRHGILLSAQTRDGFEVDVTEEARFARSRPGPFEVTLDRAIRATDVGEGIITAHFKGKQVDIPVKVHGSFSRRAGDQVRSQALDSLSPPRGEGRGEGASQNTTQPASALAHLTADSSDFAALPVSFVRDVLPALSKAGCNAGACHAKADGQNGFKLSVFTYDPNADHAEIVKDARGRRVFPAAPDESLIIKKPTGALPHEGGVRFDRGSETHRLLVRWLREGMTFSLTNEPVLQRLTAFPHARRYRKGATQRLLVQAHYSDGSVRDVTRLAAFDSHDKEIAKVDERGVVTVGTLTGQGVVVARYMGFVADAQIMVPADRLLPETQYASLPKHNFIDELAYAQFQRLGLFPSDLCTDAEFLRRAYLDTIGVLPTPEEVREFLALSAADHAGEKRRKGEKESVAASPPPLFPSAPLPATNHAAARRAVIDRLLARPEFADYWANKWADLLRPNPDRVGVKSVFTLDHWLRESFRANKPYDQFVREILLAEGTNHRDGPAVIYRDRREPPELTTMFSQLFLGTRLECARCHHHPNEKWSQDDFYQFAAFFGSVKQKGAGLSPPISAGTETFYFAPGGSVKHPVSGETMSPRPPDAPPAKLADGTDPRCALADWLAAPDNPFFARAAVNRVWANFFGRGLVEPVDDFRISNPCVNVPLLDALACDFAQHGYDLKHLARTILESRLYQLSSTPNDSNLADTRNFSRAYRRRLPAEVLLDAVNDATGVPDTFAALPAASRATQAWSYKIESQFLDAFSRPNPSSDPPCERDTQMSVVQSLHLMNSKNLQAKLSNKEGRTRKLAEGKLSPSEIVAELYLTTLSRPPTEEELSVASAVFTAKDATRQTATEDVFWALLNAAEFVFNH